MSRNRRKNTRPVKRLPASPATVPEKPVPPAGKLPLHKAPWPLYLLGALVVLALATVVVFSPGPTGDNSRSGPDTAPVFGRSTPEAGENPRLRVDRESIDLGDVKLGTMVEAAFVLTNTGGQTLRLSEPPYIEVVEGC